MQPPPEPGSQVTLAQDTPKRKGKLEKPPVPRWKRATNAILLSGRSSQIEKAIEKKKNHHENAQKRRSSETEELRRRDKQP